VTCPIFCTRWFVDETPSEGSVLFVPAGMLVDPEKVIFQIGLHGTCGPIEGTMS
jgi:hypothetical protein